MTVWVEMLTRESFEDFMSRCDILIAFGRYSKDGLSVINGCCSEIVSISELEEMCENLKSVWSTNKNLLSVASFFLKKKKLTHLNDLFVCLIFFFFFLEISWCQTYNPHGARTLCHNGHVYVSFLSLYLQDGNSKNAFNGARKITKAKKPKITFIVNEEKQSESSSSDSNEKKPKIYLTFDDGDEEEEDSNFCWEDGTDFTMEKSSNKETRFFSEIRSDCIDSRNLDLAILYTSVSVDNENKDERKSQIDELCRDQFRDQFEMYPDYYRKQSLFNPKRKIFGVCFVVVCIFIHVQQQQQHAPPSLTLVDYISNEYNSKTTCVKYADFDKKKNWCDFFNKLDELERHKQMLVVVDNLRKPLKVCSFVDRVNQFIDEHDYCKMLLVMSSPLIDEFETEFKRSRNRHCYYRYTLQSISVEEVRRHLGRKLKYEVQIRNEYPDEFCEVLAKYPQLIRLFTEIPDSTTLFDGIHTLYISVNEKDQLSEIKNFSIIFFGYLFCSNLSRDCLLTFFSLWYFKHLSVSYQLSSDFHKKNYN
ncbi:hypothetical protein RFI_00205 [Reticulomyxa filosa]|uniref:Uncharacterized protein n=1 Tax=Reticulomyxa filosa TaxID=46433 RepID=X6PFI6_RETFI|nr:hypothetical protein RFI_00205 [Reticulomyxa filosa]|eukprot:ETO36858.1 hypothetical protein RFI_00205 [Reticulomyxa filosa]